MRKPILLFLALFFAFSNADAQYRKAYILSEGGFSAGSSKLSLYNVTANTFTLSIFSPGTLGLYPDGIIYNNGFLYILEQGGYGGQGKIYKLDSNGTVQNSLSFGTNPYSLAVANNKIYTTNGLAGKVIVLNQSNFSIVKEINSGVFPQEIISFGNYVFACNTSLFGGNQDSTVSVINVLNDSLVAKINVMKDPSSLAITNDSNLLIGCPGANGKIYKVNPNTFSVTGTFSLSSGFDRDMSVDRFTGNVYYLNYNNGVSKLNLSNGQVDNIINNSNPSGIYYYGYNYDHFANKHYLLDAKNFTVSGSLNIFGSSGSLEQSFATGIAPRRIVFGNPGTTSVQHTPEFVENYSLDQNYPNPFNQSSIINFKSSISGIVRIVVYDLSGREVKILVNEVKTAGSYSVAFDASSLSSGIYFYKMTAGEFSDVKKMILVR